MKNYRDLIVNKNRSAYLPKLEKYRYDKADLCAYVSRFAQKYPYSEITEKLNEICCQDCDTWGEVREERQKRIDVVKELLYSAWLVCIKHGNTYEHSYYIFPYKINETTGYLFLLHIPYSENNVYETLNDTSVDIGSWENQDMIFREIDLDFFIEHAKSRCDHILDARLKKLVERDKVIKE